jgi:ABC-2 type transport system ATP-binding protein
MAPVIELDNLEVRLGTRTILQGLNGSLNGRAIGLLGPNGAGKSTLINTLLGFHPPSSGTARIFGEDIRHQGRSLRRLIGYMPENDSFIADWSAVRFVRMMAELSGLPSGEALERAHEAFYYVGLGEARYRNLGTYSLGMKQLAKLAQAIAHGPKLLFLDEPTNGLDPAARVRMIRLIREVRDTKQVHLIISSHLLRDVEECCEEVVILKDGRLVASCNLEEERRANLNFIEMEVLEGSGGFQEGIDRLGCDYAALGHGRYKMVLREGIAVKDLYRIAAERDAQIRKLNHRQDSLEDIFLKAMEN